IAITVVIFFFFLDMESKSIFIQLNNTEKRHIRENGLPINGVVFFAEYAEGTGHGPFIYSVLYNGAYLGLEALITLIIISIPPVTKALNYVKKMALT
ncbi:MAG: energy-coupled thiamine transporter ThiT, partial [Lachnospiraceae bacterium]|nr:energy-coupled thiamine transporter ThiT [Lachnospiraceae bacterium]